MMSNLMPSNPHGGYKGVLSQFKDRTYQRNSLFYFISYTLLNIIVLYSEVTTSDEAAWYSNPWYPPAGLTVFLLLRFGMGYLPVVLFTQIILAFITIKFHLDLALLLIAVFIPLGYGFIVWIFRRLLKIDPKLNTTKDLFKLIIGAVIGSLLVGLSYSIIAIYVGLIERNKLFDNVVGFWIGDTIGILLITPFLTNYLFPFLQNNNQPLETTKFYNFKSFIGSRKKQEWIEAILFLSSTFAIFWLIFISDSEINLFYLLFLITTWYTFRTSYKSTILINLIFNVLIILTVKITYYKLISILELQTLLLALTIYSLTISLLNQEQEEIRGKFIQSQKLEAIGKFAGGIAHDFNNILTGILGYTEILEYRLANAEPEILEEISAIRQSTLRASYLSKQLVAFSRDQENQILLFDLNLKLKEMKPFITHLIDKRITLNVNCGEERCFIRGDPLKFDRMILNLVTNAVEAISNTGTIKIDVFKKILKKDEFCLFRKVPKGQYACLIIEDDGVGIDPDQIESIFEPFYSTKSSGTGLGLSIVYNFLESFGAFINVSSGLNTTTKFELLFPLTTSTSILESENIDILNSNAISFPNHSVLIVDDNNEIVEMLTKILEIKQFKVYHQNDPLTALKLVNEEKLQIDLLITDIVMPNLSGIQLAEEIKAKLPDTKILLISGHVDEDQLISNSIDVTSILQKPFTQLSLIHAIEELLVP